MKINKENMMASVQEASSVWFEYKLSRKKFDGLFLFFEGEDRKYYNQRVEHYTKKEVKGFTCNNRKNVLEVMQYIKDDTTNKELFFIDKDYRYSHSFIEKNIFQTDCYSVENYYTDKKSFKKFLKDEVGINSEKELECLSNQYDYCRTVFHKEMISYNLFAAACRNEKIKVQLDKIKWKSFITIKIDEVIFKEKLSIEKIFTLYEEYLNSELKRGKKYSVENFENFNNGKEKIRKFHDANFEFFQQNIYEFMRGKDEFYFLKEYIKILKKENKEQKLMKTYNTFYFEPCSNFLSTYSKYAITSPQLINFLKKYS